MGRAGGWLKEGQWRGREVMDNCVRLNSCSGGWDDGSRLSVPVWPFFLFILPRLEGFNPSPVHILSFLAYSLVQV